MMLSYFLPVLLLCVFVAETVEARKRGVIGELDSDLLVGDSDGKSVTVENKRNTHRRHRHHNTDGGHSLRDTDDHNDEDSDPDSDVQEAASDVEHIDDTAGKTSAFTKTTDLPALSTACPKCVGTDKEKQARIEVVKQQLLGKLGLESVPHVEGPLHPLPFDFYRGEDFAQNDEEMEEESYQPVTREIFVFGKDSKYVRMCLITKYNCLVAICVDAWRI